MSQLSGCTDMLRDGIQIIDDFIHTVRRTGGVHVVQRVRVEQRVEQRVHVEHPDSLNGVSYHPEAEPNWVALGALYIRACQVMGYEPCIAPTPKTPCCPACKQELPDE